MPIVEDRFVTIALQQRYRITNPPKEPNPDTYTAFDANGRPVAKFSQRDVARYEARGLRVEHTPPTRQAIVRYNTYIKRKTELENQFQAWEPKLWETEQTNTDYLDATLSEFEQVFNSNIHELLTACVGKAFVL